MAKTVSNEDAILMAAETLFLQHGYAQVSTTQIARAAGCSQAMVHYYYRSKENLFSLVFRNKIAPFLNALMEIKDENIPFEDRIEKRVRAHFKMLSTNERMPMILLNEVVSNPVLSAQMLEHFKDLPMPLFEGLQAELDEAFRKGHICKTQAPNLVFLLISLNLTTLFLKPVLRLFLNATDHLMEGWVNSRIDENVRIILDSLKPKS